MLILPPAPIYLRDVINEHPHFQNKPGLPFQIICKAMLDYMFLSGLVATGLINLTPLHSTGEEYIS